MYLQLGKYHSFDFRCREDGSELSRVFLQFVLSTQRTIGKSEICLGFISPRRLCEEKSPFRISTCSKKRGGVGLTGKVCSKVGYL